MAGDPDNTIEAEVVTEDLPPFRAARRSVANGTTEQAEDDVRYVFHPSWRAQFSTLCAFAMTGIGCVILCRYFPWMVLTGKLVEISGHELSLSLPLPMIVPLAFLGKAFVRVHDAVYIVDTKGVEAHVGLLSSVLFQPRLRHEDIRGVEPIQTISQRLLGIGDVVIGSATQDGGEIVMEGVENPRGIQMLISREMDRRTKQISRGSAGQSQAGD